MWQHLQNCRCSSCWLQGSIRVNPVYSQMSRWDIQAALFVHSRIM